MARTPQSFQKRQREIRKQRKREEKLERRLIRSEEKKLAKLEPEEGDDLRDPDELEDGAEEHSEERSRQVL